MCVWGGGGGGVVMYSVYFITERTTSQKKFQVILVLWNKGCLWQSKDFYNYFCHMCMIYRYGK